MNVLNELLVEPDINQYKFAFIKIANKIQNMLIEKDDYISFLLIYSVIINKALNQQILCNYGDIEKFSESYEMMKQKYDAEYENLNPKTKKKSMFSLFKKGE